MRIRRTVEEIVVDADRRVRHLEQLLDEAKSDRAKAFALAQERHGRSAGDISRLLGPAVRPEQVSSQIRVGRRLLQYEGTR